MKRFMQFTAFCGMMALGASQANAVVYNFYQLTNNNSENLGAQLQVEVTANGSQVDFKFTNNVGIASSIADIYFDDGTLLGIASITDSGAGVAFAAPAVPSNLPGGNGASPPFVTTTDFSADSDNPIADNGVNAASEWVTITFDLQGGGTFQDVVDELASGALRIGLHVQAIGVNGGSDGYINLPAPGAVLIGLMGLGLVPWARRRFA